jgi:hypothetical protein
VRIRTMVSTVIALTAFRWRLGCGMGAGLYLRRDGGSAP